MREREREREMRGRYIQSGVGPHPHVQSLFKTSCKGGEKERECVYLSLRVCACAKEGERDRVWCLRESVCVCVVSERGSMCVLDRGRERDNVSVCVSV